MARATGRGAGVARTFGVGEAGGSNPLVPTILSCVTTQNRGATGASKHIDKPFAMLFSVALMTGFKALSLLAERAT